MNNKIMVVFLAVFIVSIAVLAGMTFAYKGTPNVKGPNYNADVHEQLEAAMDSGDYDAWLRIRSENSLPTKGRMFQVVNKANFARYVEMHNANLAGDTAKAEFIRAELGLGAGKQESCGSNTGNCMRGTGCMKN